MAFDWRILLSALSSAAPTFAQARANERAQDDLHRGRLETMAAQQTADQGIGDAVMNVAGGDPESERKAAAADYTAAVRKVRNEGTPSMPSTTLGGDRFRADTAAGSAAVASYGNQRAGQMARIDAPMRQRVGEGQRAARAGVDATRARSRASSADYLARMRAQSSAQVSPWLKLLAALGSQIADNYQRSDEQTQPDGLELIDMSALPQRIAMPRPREQLRQIRPFEG